MFTEKEVEEFLEFLFKDKESAKALNFTMKKLYSSYEQYRLLQAVMSIAAKKIAEKRPVLKMNNEPSEEELSEALAEIIDEIEVEEKIE